MKMTTREWVRHLKHYVETHGFSATEKSYMLVILNIIEEGLQSSTPKANQDE